MSARFYYPQLESENLVQLEKSEAHHLSHVLRKQSGDQVVLFDGAGLEVVAEVKTVSKRRVELELTDQRKHEPAPRLTTVLASAAPKGDRLRWLVEKATELGVDRLILLRTERSEVHPKEGKLQKLHQTVISACKQTGRNRLMQIEPVIAWSQFLETLDESHDFFLADLVADASVSPAINCNATSQIVAIGPEGDWTEREKEAAYAKGAKELLLANQILRVETAGVAAAAWMARNLFVE